MKRWPAVLLSVAFSAMFMSAASNDKIEKLALECASGNQKACDKLARIAMNSKKFSERIEAVEKLSDSALLAQIARSDKDHNIQIAAIKNPHLSEQEVFSQIARSAEYFKVREAAIERLADPSVLVFIVKNDADGSLREAAVENPNFVDQKTLSEIAQNDESKRVRRAAVMKITSQESLAAIAPRVEGELLSAVLSRITDQAVLASLISENTDNFWESWKALKDGIDRISDQALLAQIAIHADIWPSWCAMLRISEPALFADIIRNRVSRRWQSKMGEGHSCHFGVTAHGQVGAKFQHVAFNLLFNRIFGICDAGSRTWGFTLYDRSYSGSEPPYPLAGNSLGLIDWAIMMLMEKKETLEGLENDKDENVRKAIKEFWNFNAYTAQQIRKELFK